MRWRTRRYALGLRFTLASGLTMRKCERRKSGFGGLTTKNRLKIGVHHPTKSRITKSISFAWRRLRIQRHRFSLLKCTQSCTHGPLEQLGAELVFVSVTTHFGGSSRCISWTKSSACSRSFRISSKIARLCLGSEVALSFLCATSRSLFISPNVFGMAVRCGSRPGFAPPCWNVSCSEINLR
jgi:hypothetical protein